MVSHYRYLRHVLRHKWWVLVMGLNIGVPLWRLLLHDWSKFTPAEWFPYVYFFHHTTPEYRAAHFTNPTKGDLDFLRAFNIHNKHHAHHWEYWVQVLAGGDVFIHEMTTPARLEMLADWLALARESGKAEWAWWELNQDRILLGQHTRAAIVAFFEERKSHAIH